MKLLREMESSTVVQMSDVDALVFADTDVAYDCVNRCRR